MLVGELNHLGPEGVENRRLTLAHDAVTSLYKASFPGRDKTTLTKRCGTLAVALAANMDDDRGPPRVLLGAAPGAH
ncbi:hypothetical protein [Thiohalorhabdus sp.]|uniref:hypothetical protein n=1 Tax=Thiohalorhabdus sp. TaxID=3094134 RepID=UPI002FC3CFFA